MTKDLEAKIDGTSIRIASTIFLTNNAHLQNAVWLKQGNFSLCLILDRGDTTNLINLLNQHIDNIHANEIELIALNTKAAA
ncbi:MAG: hypothetical protein Q8M99_11720 [Methylotenera sp.]|nr:hypothetical protein [Methylotenera sp.]